MNISVENADWYWSSIGINLMLNVQMTAAQCIGFNINLK